MCHLSKHDLDGSPEEIELLASHADSLSQDGDVLPLTHLKLTIFSS